MKTTPFDKSQAWKIFDLISKRYDFLNHFLSFGIDAHWRKVLASFLPDRKDLKVLDLATGTGDVLFSFLRLNPGIQSAVGIDLSEKMLDEARLKAKRMNLGSKLEFRKGDAKELSFSDQSFDCVSMAFGIRNVDDPVRVLKETQRVLKPGGRALILEFSIPQNFLFRGVYLFYLRQVVPFLGGVFSGNYSAYKYLNQSIEQFAYGEAFKRWMNEAGFLNTGYKVLMGGVATIYYGDTLKERDSIKRIDFENIKDEILGQLTALKERLKNDGRKIFRIETSVPDCDILLWLKAQKDETKIFWSDRDHDLKIAALGIMDVVRGHNEAKGGEIFDRLSQNLSADCPGLRYYGGIGFDQKRLDNEWADFGSFTFIAPRFELYQRGEQTRLAVNVTRENLLNSLEEIKNALHQLQFEIAEEGFEEMEIKSILEYPNRGGWRDMFSRVHDANSQLKMEKVVLAKKVLLQAERPVDPFAVFIHLRDSTENCFHFYFQIKKGSAFLGASPEQLYRRQGQSIYSEALAGTKPRGDSFGEDDRLKEDLIHSTKETLEHRYVVHFIKEALNNLCQEVHVKESENVLQVASAQHLITRFEGILKSEVRDAEILQKLHPTPAVCGCPQQEALELIRNLEPFSRGWYTGPVGCIGLNDVNLAVGLRCALIRDREVHLFAGAGIVTGSTEEGEWQEIENKNSIFMQILKVDEKKPSVL